MRTPILFDVTRLYSRRGKSTDTGVDRVERGIFENLALIPENRFLVRFGRFYFTLRAENFRRLLERNLRGNWKNIHALWKECELSGIGKIKPASVFSFVSVGHTGHDKKFWVNLDNFDISSYILVHDTIPLDFPKYCRRDQLGKFKVKFEHWSEYSHRVIAPSEYTRSRLIEHGVPRVATIVIPNAVPPLKLSNKFPEKNAFLVLGTIEPRKNHMLLFRVWEDLYQLLGEDCPKLWIIGARGWNNKEVFEFLDKSPLMGKFIFELGALSDEKMLPYFEKSKAILFPSFVEGFGLPFFEALTANKEVIASDIPCFQEAVTEESLSSLLPVDDVSAWKRAILKPNKQPITLKNPVIMSWRDYVSLLTQL